MLLSEYKVTPTDRGTGLTCPRRGCGGRFIVDYPALLDGKLGGRHPIKSIVCPYCHRISAIPAADLAERGHLPSRHTKAGKAVYDRGELSERERSDILHHNIESSDCGVVAVAAVTGLGYDRAEEALSRHGYVSGTGTPRGGCQKALEDLGWVAEPVLLSADSQDTPATFAVGHEYGRFLLYVHAHVMALVDGGLLNGVGSWGKPLEDAFKISKRD